MRQGLRSAPDWKPAWRAHDLADRYDVVIVGGGIHGLATAYYLASRHGITNVAVLDMGYLGGGGSGRNTAIARSNYLTPEGVAFYDRSVKLYERLSAELNFNIMFSQRGHLTLAHSDASLRTMRWRAEVNKLQGVDSEVIGPDEIKRMAPALDVSDETRYPILGALYHPPGGIIRHDAVVWGYARAADLYGVHLHQRTEVLGIETDQGRVTGVRTSRGRIATGTVVNCTAGWSTLINDMVGVRTPIVTYPLQAAVTEPVKPFLDPVVVSGTLHVYVSQTARGELVFGASVDPFAQYSMRGSLDFIEDLVRTRARAHARPVEDAIAAPVGRAVRHDARLQPDHGPHRRRGLPGRHRMGHLRVQSRPRRRRADGPAHQRRQTAHPHRTVRRRAFPRRRAGRREGSSFRWPLTASAPRAPRSPPVIVLQCPWCGPRNVSEFHSLGEVVDRPDPSTANRWEWRSYLYLRRNPAGRVHERWFHRAGCRRTSTPSATLATTPVFATWRLGHEPTGAES